MVERHARHGCRGGFLLKVAKERLKYAKTSQMYGQGGTDVRFWAQRLMEKPQRESKNIVPMKPYILGRAKLRIIIYNLARHTDVRSPVETRPPNRTQAPSLTSNNGSPGHFHRRIGGAPSCKRGRTGGVGKGGSASARSARSARSASWANGRLGRLG